MSVDPNWHASQKEEIHVTQDYSYGERVVLYGGEVDERNPFRARPNYTVRRGSDRAISYHAAKRHRIPRWAADAIRKAFPDQRIPEDRIRD